MPSRDRLSKEPIRYEVEKELESMLKNHPALRRLQAERRQHDVESTLNEERPLEEVLTKVFKSSPALRSLFMQGQRLSRAFADRGGRNKGSETGTNSGDENFSGRRHPTYFQFENKTYGEVLVRNCEDGRRVRVKFVTDVEDEYFERATDKGQFDLEILDSTRELMDPSYSLTLEHGTAILNMLLPSQAEVDDAITIQTSVADSTLDEPFINIMNLSIIEQRSRPGGGRRKKKGLHNGSGNNPSMGGIELPRVVPVRENDEYWQRHCFTPETAAHVESDDVEVNGRVVTDHIFYLNIDNSSLKTEMKYSKQDPRILEAKFKYGNILLGLALLHDDKQSSTSNGSSFKDTDADKPSVQERIRLVSSAVAPVLLPMIDQLSGLDQDQIEELSVVGEDA